MSHPLDDIKIYHGTWIPKESDRFDNPGKFVFWVETIPTQKSFNQVRLHPNHVQNESDILNILNDELSLPDTLLPKLNPTYDSFYTLLPTEDKRALPSTEMAVLTGDTYPEFFEWETLKIQCISIDNPILFLKEFNFQIHRLRLEYRLGSDLKFWIKYTFHLRNLVTQHLFIPILKPYRKGKNNRFLNVSMGWEPTSEPYEMGLVEFSDAMPGICQTKKLKHRNGEDKLENYWNPKNLLQNYSENQLDFLVSNTNLPQGLSKKFDDTWLSTSIMFDEDGLPESLRLIASDATEQWNQWYSWKKLIDGDYGTAIESGFKLGIRLEDPILENDTWNLVFFVSSKNDPSLQVDLSDWWEMEQSARIEIQKQFGSQFERTLLVNLGNAGRICPFLWQGMQTSKPTGFKVIREIAYEFLKNDAPRLDSIGIKIVLPSWWLPEGRKRIKLKIKASNRKRSKSENSDDTRKLFGENSLIQYDYNMALGDTILSEGEWYTLSQAKHPLVQIRGQWMELDSNHLDKVLSLWKSSKDSEDDLTLGTLAKKYITSDHEEVEYEFDEELNKLLKALRQHDNLEEIDSPEGLNGELRPYQKKGLYWLNLLEHLGLNPCLADDMGLGKTVQIIALLLSEREQLDNNDEINATLLIAPTSVLSNWRKEIRRFAPEVKSFIHHGSDRKSKPKEFNYITKNNDVIITSFAIARNDRLLLKKRNWHRIVVDEAQNIKNPNSATAKAICSLKAKFRVALTGTPIENRLMDLWSLFNYLNPGYLGNATQFKNVYEKPIQRDGDQQRTALLQRLVQPFILRRLKTDKSIIKDLPEKVEQKVYCNLTREQALLYQAVVDDIKGEINNLDGMERRGLILSSLTKLKQICNHPMQFMQDGSEFSESRSLKLKQLNSMIEVSLEKSESLLVFTQFASLGNHLETFLRKTHHCPVYFLQGSTSRKKREKMIDSFQDPESPASIFVLSLKAGGVGINLTQANHVFHYDRWWNPAVENQATDRAYRIGQEKTVFAYKMITTGTLEEKIDELLIEKQQIADSIVGTSENWITEMDDEDFTKLIELNAQAIMDA